MAANQELDAAAKPRPIPRSHRDWSGRSPLPMVAVEGRTHVVTDVNPAFARLAGRERGDLVGRPFPEAVPDGNTNGCLALLDRVLRTGTPETLVEQEHHHTPSRLMYWSYSAWAILGADERPAGVMIQVTDVTEVAVLRRRAAAMNEAIVLASVRQHERTEAAESRNSRLQEAHDRLQARAAERTAELAAANAALRAETGSRVAAEADLQATTRQLFQAARLAGVGELAAGVAHELNNPLATVGLRLEGLLAKTPPDDPRRRPLEVIDQEVERMGRLVRNLLQFSRPGRDAASSVNVPEEVTRTVELIQHHLHNGRVRVEPEFAPDAPLVHADRQQLRQVLLNLLTNAADAMPAGGRLALRVRPGDLPGGRPALVLEVADTGAGIPPEHMSRIFDPFFTTKEEGKGTGLGLAICKRIVEQHQGTVEVHSRVGEGTTIRVNLPVRPDTDLGGSPSA